MSWRLVCPRDNWRGAIDIDDSMVPVLQHAADKLHLVCTKDDKNKKIYLDNVNGGKTLITPTIQFPLSALPVAPEPTAPSDAYFAGHFSKKGPLIVYTAQTKHIRLSDNFTLSEFACHDASYTQYVRIHPSLIAVLEAIRLEAGSSIHITSAYRPAPYNKLIGGASESQHIAGTAADIYCSGLSTTRLCNIVDSIMGQAGGVGYYPKQGFVHVDIRNEKSRWEE